MTALPRHEGRFFWCICPDKFDSPDRKRALQSTEFSTAMMKLTRATLPRETRIYLVRNSPQVVTLKCLTFLTPNGCLSSVLTGAVSHDEVPFENVAEISEFQTSFCGMIDYELAK